MKKTSTNKENFLSRTLDRRLPVVAIIEKSAEKYCMALDNNDMDEEWGWYVTNSTRVLATRNEANMGDDGIND